MELSLVILNYKTKGLLKQCLRGIIDSNLAPIHEVIVVDNNSADGSLDMVRENYPQVTVIASPTNVGYAAGMNIGLKRARGQYVMILNPDVAVFRQAVDALIGYLRANQRVGLAAPKLINPDGTTQCSCYQFPNAWIPILRRTPLGQLPGAKKLLQRYLMSDWDHRENRPVGWVLGACMIFRKEALEKIGYFDERYFLYFEDVDICRRFWQADQQVHYVADAEMVHYHQRLSAETSGLAGLFAYPTRVHIKSGIKYFAKYMGAAKPPYQV